MNITGVEIYLLNRRLKNGYTKNPLSSARAEIILNIKENLNADHQCVTIIRNDSVQDLNHNSSDYFWKVFVLESHKFHDWFEVVHSFVFFC